MQSKVIRNLSTLELEERILNGAVLIAMVSVALPWISGDWPGGENVSYSGFGYSTSYIGFTIFLLNLFLLLMTLVPLMGGPVFIKIKRQREMLRLWLTGQSVILILAALTVLMRVSSVEFTRLNVRFGVYTCLAASIVALFEASQRYISYRRTVGKELFHHPEDQVRPDPKQETFAPPPPPPPPPPALQPEDHRLYP